MTIFALLLAWAGFYYNTNWRIRILEQWKSDHQTLADAAAEGFSTLVEAIATLKQIAKGQDRRLEMLEDK